MDILTTAAHCGPAVNPLTTASLIKAESDFNPLAIRNITQGKSYNPTSMGEALTLLNDFMNRGDRLAIGLMQITTPWLKRFNINAGQLLDSCTNIRYGTSILAGNYQACSAKRSTPQTTLECALSAYWSGNGSIGGVYVNQVYRVAGSPYRMPVTAGVSDGILGIKTMNSGRAAIVPGFDFGVQPTPMRYSMDYPGSD